MHNDHKQMLKALGANIQAARLKTGISLGTLAKLSGVSKGNLSKIEHGGNVTTLCLYRLCWSIGIHPAKVLPAFRPKRAAAWPNDQKLSHAVGDCRQPKTRSEN